MISMQEIHPGSIVKNWPVTINSTKKKGRHLRGRTSFNEGDIIMEEKPVQYILLNSLTEQYCQRCLASKDLAISCASCESFLCPLCVEEGKEDMIHAHSCQYLRMASYISISSGCDVNLLRLMILLLVQKAEGGGEDTQVHFDRLLAHESYFSEDFKLAINIASLELKKKFTDGILANLDVNYSVAMACRINSNSHAVFRPASINQVIGVGIFPLVAMLNHSCNPNSIYTSCKNAKMQVKACKQIKENEELTVSYINPFKARWERRGLLLSTKHFWCQCSRCSRNGKDRLMDSKLEGVMCRSCKTGILVPTEEEEDRFQCISCASSSSRSEISLNCLELPLIKETVQAKKFEFALSLLNRSFQKAEELLDPFNLIFYNLLDDLIIVSLGLNQYWEASRYCKQILNYIGKFQTAFGIDYLSEMQSFREEFRHYISICIEGQKLGLISSPLSSEELDQELSWKPVNKP